MGTTGPDLTITKLDITRVTQPAVDRDESGRTRITIGEGTHAIELSGGRSHSENVAGARRITDALFDYMRAEKMAELDEAAEERAGSAAAVTQPDPISG